LWCKTKLSLLAQAGPFFYFVKKLFWTDVSINDKENTHKHHPAPGFGNVIIDYAFPGHLWWLLRIIVLLLIRILIIVGLLFHG